MSPETERFIRKQLNEYRFFKMVRTKMVALETERRDRKEPRNVQGLNCGTRPSLPV